MGCPGWPDLLHTTTETKMSVAPVESAILKGGAKVDHVDGLTA